MLNWLKTKLNLWLGLDPTNHPLFRQLTEAVAHHVWVTDGEGQLMYCNQSGLRMLGVDSSDPGDWTRFLHSEDRDAAVHAWTEAIRHGKPFNQEYRLKMADGLYRWHWGRASPVLGAKGQIIRWVGSAVDIHEHRELEEELKKRSRMEQVTIRISNRLLHLPPSQVHSGINEALKDLCEVYGVDKSFVFQLQPGEFRADMTHEWCVPGVPAEIALSRNLEVDQFPHVLSAFHQVGYLAINRIEDLPETAAAERALLTASGAKSSLLVPMIFRNQLIGLVGFDSYFQMRKWETVEIDLLRIIGEMFVNAIQRSIAEQDLLEQTSILARSNADLEQFAYVSSHDLQEPLRTMSVFLQLLRAKYDGKLDDQARQFIEVAVSSARRMQELIHDILTFSKVGRLELTEDNLQLSEIVDLATANLQRLIQETNAKVEFENLPEVFGDRFQLVQLLQNLISNAIKYKSSRNPHIHISGEKVDNGWQIGVRDNGIGIDSRYFDKIFQVFQRLHSREQYSGTGIGLAVAKKIIERHGGRIWVDSRVGEGSTFYFTLPDRKVMAA